MLYIKQIEMLENIVENLPKCKKLHPHSGQAFKITANPINLKHPTPRAKYYETVLKNLTDL